MASQMAILTRTRALIRNTIYPNLKSACLSTSTAVSQEPQLAESTQPSPLPPNPASGSPLYNENWRSNPVLDSAGATPSLVPIGFLRHGPNPRIQVMSQTMDSQALMNVFADWMASQKWPDMKQLFEFWIRSLDKNGKPNKPDVSLYNHYLRANLMMGANAGDLLDLVAQMEDFAILPNTASFNLVLKAMYQAKETEAAEKLLQRMLQTRKDSLPDDESYALLTEMLFMTDQMDTALKYIDMNLKSGYMLSMRVFTECVQSCVKKGRLDTLVSIINKCKVMIDSIDTSIVMCKEAHFFVNIHASDTVSVFPLVYQTMDQNKALCPPWNLCNFIANVAAQEDNSKLAFYALEFMARWIARGENARPPVLLSVDEGVVVSVLGTAARTYNQTLLDASWAILRRSLRQKKAPNAESFLGKIYAHASLGDLQRAFTTLREFETTYGNSTEDVDLFSPFTTLYPLVVACSKNGFETLDSVYFQLENLSRADPPYKSVAAVNCVILGCANICDLDRAYQTFEAIGASFGLTPDIHSYNSLMYAFGKLKKTYEASRVFDHLVSLGVKPNAMTYSLLVDAHLINRDQKAALNVIDDMVTAGFAPSGETLKKVRRRCMREMDYESDDKALAFAKQFEIRMGNEKRRNMLFSLNYSTEYA